MHGKLKLKAECSGHMCNKILEDSNLVNSDENENLTQRTFANLNV